MDRLLALAAYFATKMIRKYGLAELKGEQAHSLRKDFRSACMGKHQHCGRSNSRMLSEMALLLEVIRNLQSKLSSRDKKLLRNVWCLICFVDILFMLTQ